VSYGSGESSASPWRPHRIQPRCPGDSHAEIAQVAVAPADRGRGQLTAEHELIPNAAGRLRGAITSAAGDPLSQLDVLLTLLMPHTDTEEGGLFVELRAEGSLTEAVDQLCDEHDDIHGVLGAVDRTAPDWPPVLTALERLHRHIDNEEHGLFPAAVIALPMPAWDRLTPQR
jgi:hypothetical protein